MTPPPKPRRRRRRRRPRRRLRAPPQLVDDAVAEILLRLPPDDPACLARASAVCRTWRRILTDPAFSGRYRAFHRTPPVLGLLRSTCDDQDRLFVTTTSFRPSAADHRGFSVLDCRHGRVLLLNLESDGLVVWDPITGDKRVLPDAPVDDSVCICDAAVLCAAGASCDHRDCPSSPFLVAFLGTDMGDPVIVQACLYSSESGAWSAPTSIQLDHVELDSRTSYGITSETAPAALVGDTVYFVGEFSNEIIGYDLAAQSLSIIDPPDIYFPGHYGIMVTPVEDGRLGFLVMNYYNLCLWEMDPDEGYEWVKRWVIDVDKLLDGNCDLPPTLSGFDVGTNSILVNTDDGGVYTIELKSLQAKEEFQRANSDCEFLYTCFLTPGFASGRLPSPPVTQ